MNNFHPDSLHILPEDKRDLSHDKVFGTLGAGEIPNIDFDISPVTCILNQYWNDFCTAYSASEGNTILQGIYSTPSLVDYLFNLGGDTTLNARAKLAQSLGLMTSAEYLILAKAGKNADTNKKIIELLQQSDQIPYFCSLWQMAKTKQVRGEWQNFGANLRDAAQSLVKYGSLLKRYSPYTYNEGKPTDRPRDFLANWNNWPAMLDLKAAAFKCGTFWSVDGPLDMFDDIRSVLYKNYLESQKTKQPAAGVMFGLMWRSEWNVLADGIIKDNYSTPDGSPHCIFIRGQKIINGVPYLKIQASSGKSAGDGGIFYAPRAVINREATIPFGAFTFKDLTLGDARYYNDNNIKISDNWITAAYKVIKTILSKWNYSN